MFNKSMPGLWKWNLFWNKAEGFPDLNGLNVYRRHDLGSKGFVIRFGRLRFIWRYSKYTKKTIRRIEWNKTKNETYGPFTFVKLSLGEDSKKEWDNETQRWYTTENK